MASRIALADRFWPKVDTSGGPDACWPWTAAVQRGYGAVRLTSEDGRRTQVNAQRVAYELAYGPIPEGMHVLHSCDFPLCCNHRHLSAGTRSENMRQAHERGRVSGGGAKRRLTDEERASIQASLANGLPIRRIAREFGVAAVTVRHIRGCLLTHHRRSHTGLASSEAEG